MELRDDFAPRGRRPASCSPAWAGFLAGPRGHHAQRRCGAACWTPPFRDACSTALQEPPAHRPGGFLQVGFHRGDGLRPPRVPRGVRTGRHRRPVTLVVVVANPAPRDSASRKAGYRKTFNAVRTWAAASPALTAFGLVPSGLAGVDVAALLERRRGGRGDAARGRREQHRPAAGRGAAAEPIRCATIVLVNQAHPSWDSRTGPSSWIAESTGKSAPVSCPVVVEGQEPRRTDLRCAGRAGGVPRGRGVRGDRLR
ncbi:hypothetical protein QJS66_02950 [Kocuria rhizophila]|nr:hypothetical protein QJS66_02950 [Kocuria rhizophila]